MQQYLVFPHECELNLLTKSVNIISATVILEKFRVNNLLFLLGRIHEYHLRHSKFDPWDKSVEILPYKSSVRFKDVKPRVPESSPARQDDQEELQTDNNEDIA